MAAETHTYQPIPEPELTPNQFELSTPRDEQGRRIGVGVIFESRRTRSGKENNDILKSVIRAAMHYGRTLQEPSQAHKWAQNHRDGHSYINGEGKYFKKEEINTRTI